MTAEKPASFAKTLGLVALAASVVGLSALAARSIRGRVAARPKAVAALAPKPTSAADRSRLIYQVQCARCHGAEGHGDGPDAANLQPPPRDFASATWRFGPEPASIRKVIVGGIAGTAMYPLGNSLSPRELDAVVEHVRSLAPKSPAFESALKAAGFEPQSPAKRAPSIEVEDLGGTRRSVPSGRARLTLLVFWGTTCAPCLEKLPDLDRLTGEFGDRGLEVLPVCVDEADREVVGRLARGRFDRSPVFTNPDGMARLHYDIQTLPVAALIDRDGQLLGLARGGTDWKGPQARRLIAECLSY